MIIQLSLAALLTVIDFTVRVSPYPAVLSTTAIVHHPQALFSIA